MCLSDVCFCMPCAHAAANTLLHMLQERDACGPVGVVLYPLYSGSLCGMLRDGPLEVDHAVQALVAATPACRAGSLHL